MIELQPLLGRLAEMLTDEGLDFWTKAYQAKSVHEAARAIIKLKPEANYERVEYALTAEKALQALPDKAFKLIDIEGMVNAAGDIACPMSSNSVAEMNRQERCWRTSEPSGNLEFFMYEDMKPREFWVYPRPAAGTKVSLVYSFFPPAVTKDSITLEMRPEYENDIINFVMWRAWQREGTDQKSLDARRVFHEELGFVIQADDATHPQDTRQRDERNRWRSR